MAVHPNKDYKFRGYTSNYCPPSDVVTNAYFARHNQPFIEACSKAGVKPTKEMARRWKKKCGKAYQAAQQS